jgi:DNA ligase (NAD+)
VSGKTDYLLAGTKPGPEKLKKAADLGVEVIDEEKFRELIGEIPGQAGNDGAISDEELTLF